MAIFLGLHFPQAVYSTFQTCILHSHWGHTMCRSMVDIQSATAEIRQGKKEESKKQDKNIMSASATHGSHKLCLWLKNALQRHIDAITSVDELKTAIYNNSVDECTK